MIVPVIQQRDEMDEFPRAEERMTPDPALSFAPEERPARRRVHRLNSCLRGDGHAAGGARRRVS